MRRISVVVLLCILAAALSANAAAAKSQPATYKVGNYKGSSSGGKFSFSLKRARCGGKLQLCVSLTLAPGSVSCSGRAGNGGAGIGPLTAPVALPPSGKVSEKTPVTQKAFSGGLTETRQSGFSVTFTKKGTASGTFELNIAEIEEGVSLPCTGKAPFTAKLG